MHQQFRFKCSSYTLLFGEFYCLSNYRDEKCSWSKITLSKKLKISKENSGRAERDKYVGYYEIDSKRSILLF